MTVHNHPPYRPWCPETRLQDGSLRGACMTEVRDEIDCFVLTEMVGDLGICCDHADYDWCPKEQAEWAVRVVCPSCIRSGVKLWCSGCKDFLMHTEDALACASCDEVIVPARRGIATIDPINKRGAA